MKQTNDLPKINQHWSRSDGDTNGATIVSVTQDKKCFGGYDIEIRYDKDVAMFNKDLSTFLSRFYQE